MTKNELYKYTLKVDASEIEGFKSLDPGDLPPVAEIGSKVRSHLKGRRELAAIELKHDPSKPGRHSEQQAFYDWVCEVSVPVEPWTFDVHDETQGPDWLVVYTNSHFTGLQRMPGGDDVSIGVQMEGREVWLKCPNGMISDDETEAMFMAERML